MTIESNEQPQWEEPAWEVPSPYGYPGATITAGTVGAPLLVGVAVTMIGIVIASAATVRWPGAVLVLLSLSAVILVTSVQCSFRARLYVARPDELNSWWTDADLEARRVLIRREQKEHMASFYRWARAFRWSYNVGVLLLFAGTSALLAPPQGTHSSARWVASIVVAVGLVGQVVWIGWDLARGLDQKWWSKDRS